MRHVHAVARPIKPPGMVWAHDGSVLHSPIRQWRQSGQAELNKSSVCVGVIVCTAKGCMCMWPMNTCRRQEALVALVGIHAHECQQPNRYTKMPSTWLLRRQAPVAKQMGPVPALPVLHRSSKVMFSRWIHRDGCGCLLQGASSNHKGAVKGASAVQGPRQQ